MGRAPLSSGESTGLRRLRSWVRILAMVKLSFGLILLPPCTLSLSLTDGDSLTIEWHVLGENKKERNQGKILWATSVRQNIEICVMFGRKLNKKGFTFIGSSVFSPSSACSDTTSARFDPMTFRSSSTCLVMGPTRPLLILFKIKLSSTLKVCLTANKKLFDLRSYLRWQQITKSESQILAPQISLYNLEENNLEQICDNVDWKASWAILEVDPIYFSQGIGHLDSQSKCIQSKQF